MMKKMKGMFNNVRRSSENKSQMEPSNSSLQKVGGQHDAGIEIVAGFEDDARKLVKQLMGGKKQLQIISVVGMAGLGKTTLVRKVFNEPSIVYHFHVRAWTTVTQEPKRRDLLLGILKSGFNAGNENSSDMELSATLKMMLSGQRYLIVMDDIWDSKDWNNLMLCFPDDNVGSRIVFTTRLAHVPLQVQPGCYQYHLRFLTDKESWDLLRYKVFLNESCPSSLIDIGVRIARKCRGLPLSIVVIAGTLASDTTRKWWSQVARDISSVAGRAPEQYTGTLLLSYNHLPNHLKPCFLYFAAFPEDYEIPAWKLILLWVAEGFIEIPTAENNLVDEGNNLEEVAAGYLKDLISRSLVIVSKSRSNGGIKACIVHDVLRDFCIKKADEVNFLHQIPSFQRYVFADQTHVTVESMENLNEDEDNFIEEKENFYKQVPTYLQRVSEFKSPTTSMLHRLHSREVDEKNFIWQLIMYFQIQIHSGSVLHRLGISIPVSINRIHADVSSKTSHLNVQTLLCCNGSGNSFANIWDPRDYLSDVIIVFKFLRVMDLSSIGLSNIPSLIGYLQELRYIALCIKAGDSRMPKSSFTLPTSIEKLKYLETLIVHNRNKEGLRVPKEIWMSCRLRHLILKGNTANEYSYLPDNFQTLSHLQTLSHQFPLNHCEKILEFTPNLRKLGINADLYLSSTKLTIPNLDKLKRLENLSLQNDLNSGITLEDKLSYRELSGPSMFPVTLKKITLVGTLLKWDEMQKIGMLPNLEVLKLQFEAFSGVQWETNDGGFRQLKHLALKFIKIVQWSAYSDQFPNLQHLKLDECHQLEEIPIGIGDIYTLEMIEIKNCNQAVAQSAHKIKEDQVNKGNDLLKISVFQA